MSPSRTAVCCHGRIVIRTYPWLKLISWHFVKEGSNILFGNKGIIFSPDLLNESLLLRMIQSVSSYVDAIKIGNLILYDSSWDIIKKIHKICDKPVIVDLKLMEVPFMAEKICKRALANGADGIMVCGSIGLDTVVMCRRTFPKYLFLVTQFTHCRDVISDEAADRLVELAMTTGCDGVQIPGTFPERIRKVRSLVGNKLLIISCGVGQQGPKVNSAVAAGADYEIIGRSIYAAGGNSRFDVKPATEAARRIREKYKLV